MVLRGRACMELSRNWIKTEYAEQRISIGKEKLCLDFAEQLTSAWHFFYLVIYTYS